MPGPLSATRAFQPTIADRGRFSYWGQAIVAAAARLTANTFHTEGLNHGQPCRAVRVVDPLPPA